MSFRYDEVSNDLVTVLFNGVPIGQAERHYRFWLGKPAVNRPTGIFNPSLEHVSKLMKAEVGL